MMKSYFELVFFSNGRLIVYQIPHNIDKVKARAAIANMRSRQKIGMNIK